MASKPAFAQSAQVDHPKFGLGSVLSCNEEYIVIKFDDHGEKKFVLSIVMPNLKKSDRVPPAEKRRSSKKKVAGAAAPATAAKTTAPAAAKEVVRARIAVTEFLLAVVNFHFGRIPESKEPPPAFRF